jgi:hypothetical protein
MSNKDINGFRIRLSLQDSEPEIWREVCLPSDFSLAEIHDVIQVLMAWDDYHLHQFKHEGRYIGPPEVFEDFREDFINEKDVSLGDVFKRKGSRFEYEYDFGDSWGVDVVCAGKMKPVDELFSVIGGRMAAPPEDCGGIPGFYNMVEVLGDPEHPDYDMLSEWMGDIDFDPKEFNLEICNIGVSAIGKRHSISITSDNTPSVEKMTVELFLKKFKAKLNERDWDDVDDEFLDSVMDELFEDYALLSKKDAMIAMTEVKDLLQKGNNSSKDPEPVVMRQGIEFKVLEDKSEYLKIPMLNQIKYLVSIIQKEGKIKLTATGALPPRYVKELYAQGYIKDYQIEEYGSKVSREDSVMSIVFAKNILEMSDIVKKCSNTLTLTKKGEKIIADDAMFFEHIINVAVTKFNWAYFDRFDEECDGLGQRESSFTLVLLDKFGEKFCPTEFYAELYCKHIKDLYNVRMLDLRSAYSCYSVRSFDRFLVLFGLVELKDNIISMKPNEVKTTELFKKLVCVRDI